MTVRPPPPAVPFGIRKLFIANDLGKVLAGVADVVCRNRMLFFVVYVSPERNDDIPGHRRKS